MDNFLPNGAILPSGLLGQNDDALDAFKKTYQNSSLRLGIIIESYPINSSNNLSKTTPEYDVTSYEQNENQAATVINYKHCVAASSLGSIADFLDVNHRKLEKQTTKGSTPSPSGQNGSIVLLLCLNSLSDKAIIIANLGHPDRKTTLVDGDPHLEGEYNGLNIQVNKTGSATLTFKGATDNDGKVKDKDAGPTVLSIEKDGSLQFKHKSIVQRHDKNGMSTLTADGDISFTTKKNFNAIATENVVIKATKDLNVDIAKLLLKASGSATLQCQKLEVMADSEINVKGSQIMVEAESMAQIKASSITLDGMVALGGAGGQPILLLGTMFIGTGNLGIPVISNAIAGFATKVTAT